VTEGPVTSISLERTGARATITLARPERHNAFDAAMIAELSAAFEQVSNDSAVRVVLLESTGASFCAGADLGWMKASAGFSPEENRRDALALAHLMELVDRCPVPVIALVQGAAYGGGVGLVAACDIAIAAREAIFALSEVRLGLIPAVISPYVVAAIGARACRRYFLTGERFCAEEAHQLGLVHEVVAPEVLLETRERFVSMILAGGRRAQGCAKELIRTVAHAECDERLTAWTAEQIAAARASDEGKEGVRAFLEKRPPGWAHSSQTRFKKNPG
jgi:methylglutaconyl-CoA hydratase